MSSNILEMVSKILETLYFQDFFSNIRHSYERDF